MAESDDGTKPVVTFRLGVGSDKAPLGMDGNGRSRFRGDVGDFFPAVLDIAGSFNLLEVMIRTPIVPQTFATEIDSSTVNS